MPLVVLRTQRLLLRPCALDDVEALHALWTAPEVRRYLWDDRIITCHLAKQVVESSLQDATQFGIGYWAIHARASDPVAPVMDGFCGFRFIENSPDIELMYGLRGEHWGKGLATEACVAALDYFWKSTTFPQVFARTDPPNHRSVRVMRRLGMTRDSTNYPGIVYYLRRPA